MKILLFPALIALSLPHFAGLATPSDEQAVLAAEKQYFDGMVKSDPASVAKVLADDLSYTHSHAKMQNKAEVLKGSPARSNTLPSPSNPRKSGSIGSPSSPATT